ncbi:hypothetical protein AVEN_136192-1 [Araneus ventricosus]|uniref:Uncharacterized protein n=1 Tax=Araneus ventricosus TaxID=182803 RepID=A0A4Y2T8E4_ARAVE|nr:hypothetical protein AVEN_136192-1 [Araneus ventricosus]
MILYCRTDITANIWERIDSVSVDVDEDVRKDYGEEILQALKSMSITIFPPSPNMQKLIETVECAVSLKHPDAVYKVCRNFGSRAIWIVWDLLPAEFKVFIGRIIFNLFGFPKLGQVKKSV